ncbi:MAG: hypothetical protein AMJ61_09680 [Desulfobacterales bacterium SG8_35_2]|nr:MAG: hypothetical protein AMJ61_09680 [Desulfobacterales bacterium SG8_35_2]
MKIYPNNLYLIVIPPPGKAPASIAEQDGQERQGAMEREYWLQFHHVRQCVLYFRTIKIINSR